jgi:hypothetical protein
LRVVAVVVLLTVVAVVGQVVYFLEQQPLSAILRIP